MQIKLLRDIVTSLVGSSAAKIVDLIFDKKNVNEFLIAKKLKLTINQTRNILYKLADEGLVSFVRKKDSKKGGWYTYFWTLNTGKSLMKFRDKLVLSMNALKVQIDIKRTKTFYNCPNCAIEYAEDQALLNEYTCVECGEILILKDNAAEVIPLQKELDRLNALLSEVNVEIGVILKKEEQTKGRRLKAEVKKKELERQVKKKERDRLKKKELKASGGKKVVKKEVKKVKKSKAKKK